MVNLTFQLIYKHNRNYIINIIFLVIISSVLLSILFLLPNVEYYMAPYRYSDYDIQINGEITEGIKGKLIGVPEIKDLFSAVTIFNVKVVSDTRKNFANAYLVESSETKKYKHSWFSDANLYSGKTAQNIGEVAISYTVGKQLNVSIGDKVQYVIHGKNYYAKVVGIYAMAKPAIIIPQKYDTIKEVTIGYRKGFIEKKQYQQLIKKYPLLSTEPAYTLSWLVTDLSIEEVTKLLSRYAPAEDYAISSRERMIIQISQQLDVNPILIKGTPIAIFIGLLFFIYHEMRSVRRY